MVDKLDKIVRMQLTLMDRLGVQVLDDQKNDVLIQEQTRDMLFAICCELGETGDEINWKPWKRTVKPVNLDLLRTELIDIFHFTMELMLMWGMDSKMIFEVYEKKMAENNARQDRGY